MTFRHCCLTLRDTRPYEVQLSGRHAGVLAFSTLWIKPDSIRFFTHGASSGLSFSLFCTHAAA